MTTLEELKQMRPVDSHDLQRLVNEMYAEARVFQVQELSSRTVSALKQV